MPPFIAFLATAVGAFAAYRWLKKREQGKENAHSQHGAEETTSELVYDPASGVYRPKTDKLGSDDNTQP